MIASALTHLAVTVLSHGFLIWRLRSGSGEKAFESLHARHYKRLLVRGPPAPNFIHFSRDAMNLQYARTAPHKAMQDTSLSRHRE